MVYKMKITISTVDSNTMKHGNVLNNLPAMIAYVVTSGLTKHKKRTFDQYSQQTDEFLKYTTSLTLKSPNYMPSAICWHY
jgi:hypothetical protein